MDRQRLLQVDIVIEPVLDYGTNPELYRLGAIDPSDRLCHQMSRAVTVYFESLRAFQS
ncbi:hypothetical protein D3C86_1736060 [compost metagenome]